MTKTGHEIRLVTDIEKRRLRSSFLCMKLIKHVGLKMEMQFATDSFLVVFVFFLFLNLICKKMMRSLGTNPWHKTRGKDRFTRDFIFRIELLLFSLVFYLSSCFSHNMNKLLLPEITRKGKDKESWCKESTTILFLNSLGYSNIGCLFSWILRLRSCYTRLSRVVFLFAISNMYSQTSTASRITNKTNISRSFPGTAFGSSCYASIWTDVTFGYVFMTVPQRSSRQKVHWG